jgi:hypothetical protein
MRPVGAEPADDRGPSEQAKGEDQREYQGGSKADRPPPGGTGGTGAEQHQGDARAGLDRALEDRVAEVERYLPHRFEAAEEEGTHALGENRDRGQLDRCCQLRGVVGACDRVGEEEERSGGDHPGQDLEAKAAQHDVGDHLPVTQVLRHEPRRRGAEPEVGGQREQSADADRQREDPVAGRPQSPNQEQG